MLAMAMAAWISLMVVSVGAQGATYEVTTVFSSGACDSEPLGSVAVRTACVVSSGPCLNGARRQCISGAPGGFANSLGVQLYDDASCAVGAQPSELLFLRNGECSRIGANSFLAFCYGGRFTLSSFANSTVCQGTSYLFRFAGSQCVPLPAGALPFNATGTRVFAQCQPLCFHETTRITHSARTFTLAQLEAAAAGQEAPQCVVPHVVRGNGLLVRTACHEGDDALRVTPDHLVFTSTGLRTASSLVLGDELFADELQQHRCRVVHVAHEYNQNYFGLNCARSSVVLANGVKTSLFGGVHVLPSLYMRVASRVLGVALASRVGDTMVSWLHRIGAWWW